MGKEWSEIAPGAPENGAKYQHLRLRQRPTNGMAIQTFGVPIFSPVELEHFLVKFGKN